MAIYPEQHIFLQPVLENQLDNTKPRLVLLYKKICCYQTSYMSHLDHTEVVIKNALGGYSKGRGTAHAFLYNVEVVRGYRKIEQFWAPTCSLSKINSYFFFSCCNFSRSKIFLCDLWEQKVTMSNRGTLLCLLLSSRNDK